MLSSRDLDEKTYEQYIAQAIAQIPLYSREWTNYNPSDPGITILENLSAFSSLQRWEMNQVPDRVKWKLLGLAGFTPAEGTPGEAYLWRQGQESWEERLPQGQKLYAQDICFELTESGLVRGNLTGIYLRAQGKVKNLGILLEEFGAPGGVYAFGEKPKGGEELFFLVDELPGQGADLIFSAEVAEEYPRNPFIRGEKNIFANASWAVLTDEGFLELVAEDDTWNFLVSGRVRLALPSGSVRYRREDGGCYVIRCRLTYCDYDIVPKIFRVRGLLTPAIQMDTRSKIIRRPLSREMSVNHELLKDSYVTVFAGSQKEGYRMCPAAPGGQEEENPEGCRMDIEEDGFASLKFSGEILKSTPAGGEVLIVCRKESVMPHCRLGTLYGFDSQEVELPPGERVYGKDFSLLAEPGDGNCFVFPPECREPGAVTYRVDEERNILIVEDCGDFEGAEIFLGDYGLYLGKDGNVRMGAEFFMRTAGGNRKLYSGTKEAAGRYGETLEEVRQRFAADINQPATLVTEKDCELLIRQIPGLSIDRIRAIAIPEKNQISVVIKPNSRDAFPRLSDTYRETVRRYLEKRRMLTTRISIDQPRYVPIHVRGVIRAKRHYKNSRERILEVLQRKLDGLHSRQNFGDTVLFSQVFHELEKLECVSEVLELRLSCGGGGGANPVGLDIRLAKNALSYPGEFMLDIHAE